MLESYLTIATHPLLWIFIGLTVVFYGVQWVVNPRPDHQHRRFDTTGWLRRHYVAIVFALGGAAIVLALVFYVFEVGIAVARLVDRLRLGAAGDLTETEAKDLAYGIAVLLGAMVAAATIPFTLLRTWINERTATATEEGLITDRINKAVEGLGAEKTVRRDDKEWTEPNLEVRIGAIYALERISQDSARDHIQIMEILCAYIRQNAGREDVPLPEGDPTPQQWQVWRMHTGEHLRLDVDVALKVIERRGADRKRLEKCRDEPYHLGLERAFLRGIDLSKRDISNADLEEAEFQGASLRFAKLHGVNLVLADLQGADLRHASMDDANLFLANLNAADLSHADLSSSDLGHVDLQRANLVSACLEGAGLYFALLQRANLEGAKLDEKTNLSSAVLQGAALRSVDHTNAPQITEHLPGMFGDASVILPGGHGPKQKSWPAHWPTFKLSDEQFEEEWGEWQADPDNYTPPDPLEEG